MKIDTDKLVDAPKLLEILFEADTRPTVRWVRRQQKRRTIPFYKIGRLVFFDPPEVRAALEKKNLIRAIK